MTGATRCPGCGGPGGMHVMGTCDGCQPTPMAQSEQHPMTELDALEELENAAWNVAAMFAVVEGAYGTRRFVFDNRILGKEATDSLLKLVRGLEDVREARERP